MKSTLCDYCVHWNFFRNSSVLFQELIAGWVLLPVMDTVSNPNMLNSLIVIGASFNLKHLKPKEHTNKVYYLQNFESSVDQRRSLFYKDLNEVKENTELLYTFIQFLKDEDQVHLLKFCLDVGGYYFKSFKIFFFHHRNF